MKRPVCAEPQRGFRFSPAFLVCWHFFSRFWAFSCPAFDLRFWPYLTEPYSGSCPCLAFACSVPAPSGARWSSSSPRRRSVQNLAAVLGTPSFARQVRPLLLLARRLPVHRASAVDLLALPMKVASANGQLDQDTPLPLQRRAGNGRGYTPPVPSSRWQSADCPSPRCCWPGGLRRAHHPVT